MVSIYNPEENLNAEGLVLHRGLEADIKPIFQKYMAAGYGIRDIAACLHYVAVGLACEMIARTRIANFKKRQQNLVLLCRDLGFWAEKNQGGLLAIGRRLDHESNTITCRGCGHDRDEDHKADCVLYPGMNPIEASNARGMRERDGERSESGA